MQSIVGSMLVSLGVVAVVVPKWLDSRREARRLREQQQQASQSQSVEAPPEVGVAAPVGRSKSGEPKGAGAA